MPPCCDPWTAPDAPASISSRPDGRPITLVSTVKRDAVARMGFDFRLEQIAEHIDPGAKLRQPVHCLGMPAGWRTAGRDDGNDVPLGAQALRGIDHVAALQFGDLGDLLDAAALIGVAGMGHDPDQMAAQPIGEFRNQVLGNQHAAALLAAIDLDQGLDVGGMRGDRLGRVSRSSVMTVTLAPLAFSRAT